MNIVGVFLNPEIRTGGHRRYLEFFQAASEKGHNVSIILNSKLDYKFDGLNEVRLNNTYKKNITPYSIQFKNFLKSNREILTEQITDCDYVVIHGETHLFAGIFIKNLFNSKLLFALRSNGVVESQMKMAESGNSFLDKIKLKLSELKYRKFENIINKNSDIMAFQSNFDKDSLLSRVKPNRASSVVISGNIGGDWFDMDLRDKNSSDKIENLIFVGAINQRKGISYLIKAFIDLTNNGYKLNLTILGVGDLEDEMKKLLFDANLLDRVNFMGRVSDPLKYVAKSDLMVVPSVFDSFPDVILESQHVGTQVIAARSGGMPDMLEKEDIFDVASSEAIYSQISKRCDSKNEFLKGKERLLNNRKRFFFDWAEAFINEMEK